ncbi:hypothetical protein PR202_gb07085 [Eleusine coracana subsp. coracana]|uniref:Uncharacterized protein n=1 Tax=Eleusine coracana subsp. coracana TaxID=191504 RepID=A0AAV5EBA7_ELECO|nr:hypothetical protein PR202_gb07085 [Eleusine coracana subsp. coracana]
MRGDEVPIQRSSSTDSTEKTSNGQQPATKDESMLDWIRALDLRSARLTLPTSAPPQWPPLTACAHGVRRRQIPRARMSREEADPPRMHEEVVGDVILVAGCGEAPVAADGGGAVLRR